MDYQEMYLKLFRDSKKAIDILIASHRACEEMYVASTEPHLTVLPFSKETAKPEDSQDRQ